MVVLISFLILSGTATAAAAAYTLLRAPAVGEIGAAQGTETAPESEAAPETPGYGVTGYFSLEAEGGSAIRVAPRSPAGAPALDIQVQGGRLRVTSRHGNGGALALRLIDARGRVVRMWKEILPQGGAAVLDLDGNTRGLLFLRVDGGVLGRAVRIIPPLRADGW